MKTFLLSIFLILPYLSAASETKICQKCHPVIYKEYYNSIHRKSSPVNDPIYKALLTKVKDTKKCATCHSPSAHDEQTKREEPISCVYCHTIKDIDEKKSENNNILSGKKKDFYTAQVDKKDLKHGKYEMVSSFFGLVTKSQNSPYHQIEYNNENYYNGNVCMGCHSHVNNEHNVDVIMLDAYIDIKDKETCISCHMPQIQGSKTTLSDSKTHAYHGIAGVHNMSKSLGKYIDFKVNKTNEGFIVQIINQANHALFGTANREGILEVSILRNGKTIKLKPALFTRTFGKNGVKSLPFEADNILKDTLIYAKKDIHYNSKLQKGDRVILSLGFRLINNEVAEELNLENISSFTKVRYLKKASFSF